MQNKKNYRIVAVSVTVVLAVVLASLAVSALFNGILFGNNNKNGDGATDMPSLGQPRVALKSNAPIQTYVGDSIDFVATATLNPDVELDVNWTYEWYQVSKVKEGEIGDWILSQDGDNPSLEYKKGEGDWKRGERLDNSTDEEGKSKLNIVVGFAGDETIEDGYRTFFMQVEVQASVELNGNTTLSPTATGEVGVAITGDDTHVDGIDSIVTRKRSAEWWVNKTNDVLDQNEYTSTGANGSLKFNFLDKENSIQGLGIFGLSKYNDSQGGGVVDPDKEYEISSALDKIQNLKVDFVENPIKENGNIISFAMHFNNPDASYAKKIAIQIAMFGDQTYIVSGDKFIYDTAEALSNDENAKKITITNGFTVEVARETTLDKEKVINLNILNRDYETVLASFEKAIMDQGYAFRAFVIHRTDNSHPEIFTNVEAFTLGNITMVGTPKQPT
ncbi:MAG: hypothetical protein FWF56_00790 [Firmicutes bacterium]|nr:hypothetical protein [Bacillota bacterium]MCL1953722.1 hypothetical protein [Bacillota bacterium]